MKKLAGFKENEKNEWKIEENEKVTKGKKESTRIKI